jgi:hypothetical protein
MQQGVFRPRDPAEVLCVSSRPEWRRLLHLTVLAIAAMILAYAVSFIGTWSGKEAWSAVQPVLVLGMAVIMLIASALWPITGVLLLLILLTFGPQGSTVSQVEILEAAVFVVSVTSSAVRDMVRKSGAWVQSRFMPVALLFIATVILSVLPAHASGVSISFWARRAFPFLLFMVFPVVHDACTQDERMVRIIVALLLIIGAIKDVPVLSHWYLNAGKLGGIENLQELRQAGSGVWLMSFPILAGAVAAGSRSKPFRAVLEVLTVVSLIAIAASYTRSYWLGTGVAALATVLLGAATAKTDVLAVLRHLAEWSVAALVLLFTAARGVTRKLAVWFGQRLSSLVSGAETTSVQDRLFEIRRLSQLIPRSPLIGRGLGATYSFYSPTPFSWNLPEGYKTIFYSHNFYMYHLYATGFLGLAAFVWFLATVILQCIRGSRHARGHMEAMLLVAIASLIVGMAVSSITSSEFSEKPPDLIIGILAGLASYLVSRASNAEADVSAPS